LKLQSTCVLFVLVCLSSPASGAGLTAQPGEMRDGQQALFAFGWESTWLLKVGYSQIWPAVFGTRSGKVIVGLDLPLPQLSAFSGGRFSVALASELFGARDSFGALAMISGSGVWANDSLGNKFGFGLASALQPGWFAQNWSAGLDLRYRVMLATHISHSDSVKALFGDRPEGAIQGPRDGWFGMTAHRFQGGMAGAKRWDRFSLSARGGIDYGPRLTGLMGSQPVDSLPFYIEAGSEVSF